jgi:hypothetical protein
MNIKSISYLKSHAAQISEDLAMNGTPFFITQNGEASMVIESIQQFQEKESLIAALKSWPWVKKTVCRGKAFPLKIHARNWPQLANAASNGNCHPTRCAG